MYNCVILAGGMGKRLRPITEGYPKPLVNVGAESALEHILKTLKKYEVESCALTLMYEGDRIKKRFGDSYEGIKLYYVTEEEPLGTAGGAKLAARKLEGDDVMILSGDGIFDFDLEKLAAFHKDKSAELSIGTYFCKDPTEYGTVLTDEDDRVSGFAEKAAWKSTVTGNVNTGIYVIKKSLLELCPDNEAYDFAKDLFPRLLSESKAVYAMHLNGYWCDIGGLAALRECNMDLISGRIHLPYKTNVPIGMGTHKSSIFGEGTVLKENSIVSGSAVGKGCVIGRGTKIEGSVLLDEVSVGNNCVIKNCIIAAYTELAPDRIYINKAIGCNGESTSIYKDSDDFIFTDKGILCENVQSVAFVKLGNCLCASCGKGKIGILSDGSESAVKAANEIGEGIASAGAKAAYNFGVGFEAQSAFAAYSYGLCLSVFVREEDEKIYVTLYDSSTMPISADAERNLASHLREIRQEVGGKESIRTHGLSPRYTDALIKSVYSGDIGIYSLEGLVFALEACPAFSCIRAALSLLDAQVYSPEKAKLYFDKSGIDYIKVSISHDGFDLKLSYKGQIYEKELICAVLAKDSVKKGERELPISTERAPELMWADKRIKVEKFPTTPKNREQTLARFNARRNLWIKDASFMLMRLATVLKRQNCDVKSLCEGANGVYRREMTVECRGGKVYTIEKLLKRGGKVAQEGILFMMPEGISNVVCNRAESLKIISYATNSEAAESICEDIKRKINEIL